MIIWSGYGFAVVFFALIGLVIGRVLGDMLDINAAWPLALGLFIGAALNHFTALKLDKKEKTLIDPETGQHVVFKRGDSLFWIPMKYWTYVIAALAVIMLVAPS